MFAVVCFMALNPLTVFQKRNKTTHNNTGRQRNTVSKNNKLTLLCVFIYVATIKCVKQMLGFNL